MAEPWRTFTSKVIPLPAENVDTDQIVPARYLKVTDKNGLAEALFRDWRFNEDGSLKEPRFVLDEPDMAGRHILLAGHNFGAGSSREHAPWALTAWGIGPSCRPRSPTSSGAIASRTACSRSSSSPSGTGSLFDLVRGRPDAELTVDLEARSSTCRATTTCRSSGPVRQADAARRHRRARLPPREGDRDRRLGSGPSAARRYAGRSRLSAGPVRNRRDRPTVSRA